MRERRPILFACGTPHGGAVASTLALAEQAVRQGHEVRVVIAKADPYERLPRLMGAMVRLGRLWKATEAVAWRLHDRLSARTSADMRGGVSVDVASDVPAAVRWLVSEGSVIVANSVRRLDLERLLGIARSGDAALVWYMRESTALDHVADVGPIVDSLLANSLPLAVEASALARRPCAYVPSLIERGGLEEPEERTVLLAVNPVPSHGLSLVLELARMLPHRSFALQESWPLGEAGLSDLRRSTSELPNVEVRERTDRSRVFRDAYALLLPHDAAAVGASRPRVALEAQFLGIPVVAADIPGLAAAVASADLIVSGGAGAHAWEGAVAALDRSYDRHVSEARSFADRELLSSGQIWEQFVQACGSLLEPV